VQEKEKRRGCLTTGKR